MCKIFNEALFNGNLKSNNLIILANLSWYGSNIIDKQDIFDKLNYFFLIHLNF